MSDDTQRRLLRWIQVAEERLDAGEPLYCDVSGLPAEKWARFMALASHFDFVSLDVTKNSPGHLEFSPYPSHLRVPEGLTLHDLDQHLQSEIAKLDAGQVLRVSWTKSFERGRPTMEQSIQIVSQAAD